MTDYKTGRVYKIIDTQSNICYVGSTFDTLRNRWQGHKRSYTAFINGKKGIVSIYPYFKEKGLENFKMILIKEYKVCDKRHLEAYETLWVLKLKSINKNLPFTINYLRKKQYTEANREQITEKNKQYRQNNKEIIAERNKQFYQNNKEVILLNTKQYTEKQKINQNNHCLFCDKNYGRRYKEHLKRMSHIKKETLYYFNQLPTL